jgi:hypothetical protein
MSAADNISCSAPSAECIPTRTVSVAEVNDFAKAIGLSHAAPGRCSTVLMFELYCRAVVPVAALDPAKIVAEVWGLEGVGNPVGTKRATQFKHPPLRGFWKKHYLVGGLGSVVENVKRGFGPEPERRRLHRVIEGNFNPKTAHLPPETISKNIANAIVNLYADRSRKECLTGEWIIYGKHDGKNYYLCLAAHDEPDIQIFERIKRGCSGEFPFLF